MSTQPQTFANSVPLPKQLAKYDHVPEFPRELKPLRQWVPWKRVTVKGEVKKMPFNLKTGEWAKANDPHTWTTFDEASAEFDVLGKDNPQKYEGLGFELGGTNIVGIDGDSAIKNGVIDPYAREILRILKDPYTEKSPSGEGLHTFVYYDGALPGSRRKLSKSHDGFEVYHGLDGDGHGRFLTVTGNHVLGEGIPHVDAETMGLAYLLITQNKDKRFRELWLTDHDEYDGDDSSADFDLMCRLARLTNCDAAKMEAYFSESGLGQRDKWGREDYRKLTIENAIAAVRKEKNTAPKESATKVEFHLPAVPSQDPAPFAFGPLPDAEEGWFPKSEVSIVCGPSAGGKTTWIYQMLMAQFHREPFFGHESAGWSYHVMGIDRGAAASKRTLKRMHIPQDAIPFTRLRLDCFDVPMVQRIVDVFEDLNPRPDLLVIEGIDVLISKIGDSHYVAPFLLALDDFAKHYNIAIVVTAGSPKEKINQGYALQRDKVLGSSIWGRLTETMMTFQFAQGDDMSDRRICCVLPRQAAAEKFNLKFDAGLLVPAPDLEESGEMSSASKEIEWFQLQAHWSETDIQKTWWTALDFERALDMAHSTAERHLADAVTKKYLIRKPGHKKGSGGAHEYRWNATASNPLWVAHQDQEPVEVGAEGGGLEF